MSMSSITDRDPDRATVLRLIESTTRNEERIANAVEAINLRAVDEDKRHAAIEDAVLAIHNRLDKHERAEFKLHVAVITCLCLLILSVNGYDVVAPVMKIVELLL